MQLGRHSHSRRPSGLEHKLESCNALKAKANIEGFSEKGEGEEGYIEAALLKKNV